MAEPLVSVIMPAYNAEKYLCESIRSLLDQSYTHWELLITNDGSTDKTEEILHSFADPRIKIFSHENKGVGAARNTALANMQGKYFTFLDADDTLPPDSLKLRTEYAEQHDAIDIIGGRVCFFKENGEKKNWYPKFEGDPLQAFIRIDERAFCNPSLFIRRKPAVTYRFKEGMTHVEDLLFFASLANQATHYYGYVDELVYNYRISGNSAMKNLRGLEEGYWIFFDTVKHFKKAEGKNIRYLKWRIIRIMILSYLGGKQFINALTVLPKIFKS
jgi:glycosyltransferase involved in cell wall biosynthesis